MPQDAPLDATASTADEERHDGVPSAGQLARELPVVVLVACVILGAAFAYIDNTNLVTTNGLWKSTDVRAWAEGASPRILPANLLYFPLTGTLVGALPESLGPVWRRMAVVNVMWGGLAVGAAFALVRGLGIPRHAAGLAALFQLGCGYFLALGITSEDIMGGIVFLLAAFAATVYVARRPTQLGIALVSVLFTLAWLMEWRLLLPAAPALGLGVLTLPGTWKQRATYAVVAVATVLLIATLAASVAYSAGFIDSLPAAIEKTFWPGKGVGSGWAGFRGAKVVFMLGGIGFYLYDGTYPPSLSYFANTLVIVRLGVSLAVVIGLGIVLSRTVWRRRASAPWRLAGMVLGVNFLAAQFFNLYVQPGDPQFQINPMLWLSVAWAIACARFLAKPTPARITLAAVVSLLPLLGNLATYSRQRGIDSRRLESVRQLEAHVDPARTVFVCLGSESEVTWLATSWGWAGSTPGLTQAPQADPGYKAIFIREQHITYPHWPPDVTADAVCDYIEYARERGYVIVFNGFWSGTEEQFCDSMSTITGPEKPRAIWRALKARYNAVPLESEPSEWRHFVLQPHGPASE